MTEALGMFRPVKLEATPHLERVPIAGGKSWYVVTRTRWSPASQPARPLKVKAGQPGARSVTRARCLCRPGRRPRILSTLGMWREWNTALTASRAFAISLFSTLAADKEGTHED